MATETHLSELAADLLKRAKKRIVLYGDDTWFMTDPTTVVEIDKQPFTD